MSDYLTDDQLIAEALALVAAADLAEADKLAGYSSHIVTTYDNDGLPVETHYNGFANDLSQLLSNSYALTGEDGIPSWARGATVTTSLPEADPNLNLALLTGYRGRRNDTLTETAVPDAIAIDFFTPSEKSHFTGQYPQSAHEHTCKMHYTSKDRTFRQSFNGVKAGKGKAQPWDNWRGYKMKNGHIVKACPACQHARVMSFCMKIEKASKLYQFDNLMRWQPLDLVESIRMKNRIRQNNARKAGDYAWYTTFPTSKENVILHDSMHEPGQPLPTDRTELYNLIQSWVLDTPEGNRAGHGLGKWGKMPEKKGKESGKEVSNPETETKPEAWFIVGENAPHYFDAVAAYLEIEPNYKGIDLTKHDITAFEIIDILESQAIDYEFEGNVPKDVTLYREEKKHSLLSVTCYPKEPPKEVKPAPFVGELSLF